MSRRFEDAYALLIAVDQNLEAAAALPAIDQLVITPDLLSSLLGRLAGGTGAQEG